MLNHTSGMMEDYHGIKEVLIRTFYLIVQVSHLLVAGQVKAAKPHLKQLQQRVKVKKLVLGIVEATSSSFSRGVCLGSSHLLKSKSSQPTTADSS